MKFELPQNAKLLHEMQMPVRWGDMDALGHVNNAMYFRYMESSRVAWIESVRIAIDPKARVLITATGFCSYFKQLHYPEKLRVKMYASDVGRSSFETWHTLESANEAHVSYALGGATLVWVNLQTGKSEPLPDWLRAAVS